MASNKSDRSGSPSGISEEGRRDLIARQHRALYGNDGTLLNPASGYPEEGRDQSGTTPIGGPRGPSPRAMDRFGAPGQGPSQDSVQDQQRGDKAGGSNVPPTFGGFDQAATSPAAVDDNSHSRQLSKSTTAPLGGGMAPIGSRPNTQNQPLNKRTTSPYGFGATEQNNERSTSSNSNNNTQKEGSTNPSMGTWGTGSGVWGNKIGATSVWG